MDRRQANRIEVPVVIASSDDDVSARDVGAVVKLPKPFDLDQLLAALSSAGEARRKARYPTRIQGRVRDGSH